MDVHRTLLEGWGNYRSEIIVALVTAALFWCFSKKIKEKAKKYLGGGKKVEKELVYSLWQVAKESWAIFFNWGNIALIGSLALLSIAVYIWRSSK